MCFIIILACLLIANFKMKFNKKSKKNKRQLGDTCENIVVEFLEQRDFEIIDRNCHLGRVGEIDIVARTPEILDLYDTQIVFVEVRSISSDSLVDPTQIVPRKKQRRLKILAKLWLKKHGLPEYETNWRIDLIVITQKNAKIRKIDWMKHIF